MHVPFCTTGGADVESAPGAATTWSVLAGATMCGVTTDCCSGTAAATKLFEPVAFPRSHCHRVVAIVCAGLEMACDRLCSTSDLHRSCSLSDC